MSVYIRLEQFEGPLALLLYLIRREEMDITQIPIHKMTQHFLEELRAQPDLEQVGDFIAMAATLIHIKSKMLLPVLEGDAEEEEDPRAPLVEKLLLYEAYRKAANQLNQHELLGRDVFKRGFCEQRVPVNEGEVLLEEEGLYALMSSYNKVITLFENRSHQVVEEGPSLAEYILELKDRLVVGSRLEFQQLVPEDSLDKQKLHLRCMVLTLLSLLELSRMGFLSLLQSQNHLYVRTKKPVRADVISHVESYDASQVESATEQLLAAAEGGAEAAGLSVEEGGEALPEVVATDEDILREEQRLAGGVPSPSAFTLRLAGEAPPSSGRGGSESTATVSTVSDAKGGSSDA